MIDHSPRDQYSQCVACLSRGRTPLEPSGRQLKVLFPVEQSYHRAAASSPKDKKPLLMSAGTQKKTSLTVLMSTASLYQA